MPITRRTVLNTLALTSGASIVRRAFPFSVDAQVSEDAHDPDRPGFHLLPERNWINDPCAPVFWRGQYHMFHQYNPHSAVWGDMHWAHATSPDMVHWTRQTVALAPSPGGPDAQGCFTGSSILHNGRPAIIYTGVQTVAQADATLSDGNNNFRETQLLATASDDALGSWNKHPQPVIPAPPPGMKVTGFRDPTPFLYHGSQYLLVGSGEPRKGGMVLLYRARKIGVGVNDLTQWEYLHPLLEGEWGGKEGTNPVDTGEMWECPDFFSLGVDGKEDESANHVLIYSTQGKTLWHSGKLDPLSLRFRSEKSGQLDYGRDGATGGGQSTFYAPKTQLDANGNRILWGWLPETRPQAEYAHAGWSGMISLPRRLYLNNGDLHMEPAAETQRLRASANPKVDPFPSLQQEFSCVLQAAFSGNPTPYVLSDAAGPVLEIRSDPKQDPRTVILSGGNDADHILQLPERLPAQAGLRIFLDNSVVEIFLDSRYCITRRFYSGGSRAHTSGKAIVTLTFCAPCRISRPQSFSLKSIWST